MSEISTPTIHPDDKRPFEPTKTKFGIIQREVERVGLPSHSFNISSTHALDHNLHGGDLLSVNLKIDTTESILGADISAETNASLFKVNKDQLNTDKKNPIGADVGFGDAVVSANAGFGLTGVGAQAGAELDLVSADIGPVSASVGLGVHTGAFISPTQVSANILGTGISVGEKTGISILGTSVTVDVGKLIEETTNHFVHGKNPHEIISEKIHHIEHHVGVDVTVTSIENQLVPVKTEVHDIISVFTENVEQPVLVEFTDHVVRPVRHFVDSAGKHDETEKKEIT